MLKSGGGRLGEKWECFGKKWGHFGEKWERFGEKWERFGSGGVFDLLPHKLV